MSITTLTAGWDIILAALTVAVFVIGVTWSFISGTSDRSTAGTVIAAVTLTVLSGFFEELFVLRLIGALSGRFVPRLPRVTTGSSRHVRVTAAVAVMVMVAVIIFTARRWFPDAVFIAENVAVSSITVVAETLRGQHATEDRPAAG